MRILWFPDVLRDAGLRVHLVDGWETRGSATFEPRGLICHATAGARGARAADEIRVLLTGSATAPAPIAQLYLARDGAFHVVASGRCNHALTGWAGPLQGLGNTNLVGIEAGNDNRGEPWPIVQADAYHRGVAAICRHMAWTEQRVAAHREHQPYPPPPGITSTKSDPHGIDMGQFRRAVAGLLAGEEGIMPKLTDQEQAELLQLVRAINGRLLGLVRLEDSVTATWSAVNPKASDPIHAARAIKELRARPASEPVNVDALAAAVADRLRGIARPTHAELVAALREVLADGVLSNTAPAEG